MMMIPSPSSTTEHAPLSLSSLSAQQGDENNSPPPQQQPLCVTPVKHPAHAPPRSMAQEIDISPQNDDHATSHHHHSGAMHVAQQTWQWLWSRRRRRVGGGWYDYRQVQRKSSDLPSTPSTLDSSSSSSFEDEESNHDADESSLSPPNGLLFLTSPATTTTNKTTTVQSLLIGLAFCAVWSANNVMAPNLTSMAQDFNLHDQQQRDLYLGSYCALATGVFSFPLAAAIGVLADVTDRRRLLAVTVACGGLASLWTATCRTYTALFIARLVNGGFMAGATPVAFSFLGDLFGVAERNAASAALTAMMGLGMIAGQVYAGMTGPSLGWQHAFCVSGAAALLMAAVCARWVQEPVRGGKEPVLQDMIQAGTRYDRVLSWAGFWHAMRHNQSNVILLWQGFFSSIPWGIIFVFMNDYLSQERGFSVRAATYLVFIFGLGCAAGGVLGGYLGQVVVQRYNRQCLPIFMSATTLLGILPPLVLLNTGFTHAHGIRGVFWSFTGGLLASLPSVNVRPCLINVNPPETRGASLTAANLLICLGRGVGPSCVTLLVACFSGQNVDRRFAINFSLVVFWVISAVQLAMLAQTLPADQDRMEQELASYARQAMEKSKQQSLREQDEEEQEEEEEEERGLVVISSCPTETDTEILDDAALGDAMLPDRPTSSDGKAAPRDAL